MLVREVMTSPAVTVRRTDTVRRAIRVLHGHDITAAPVLDDSGRLVGVVSEMDLLRDEFEPDPRATAIPPSGGGAPPPHRVEEVMTAGVVTVTGTTDVTVAIDLMVGRRIKSLPVVDGGGAVVGVVSRRDLMAMLARPDEELRGEVVEALREQYPGGPVWEVAVRDGVAELTGAFHHAGDEPARPENAGFDNAGFDDADKTARIAGLLARTVPGIVRVRFLTRS
uniref:CBS domain-containing protein n=1 Tax=Nonomuraea pusilla TaxID=46177 RepID=UPI0007C63691|nr:CBS domain-containing protein [Nonomuraea pusilla]